MGRLWKTALTKTLPVMAGYVVLGIGFGIICQKNGYGFFWVLAMSGLVYAGSMQFVAVGLLTSGASLLTAAVTTLMVNARHLFYGISMVDRYKGMGAIKPYLMFTLTDETYSLVCTGDIPNGISPKSYYLTVSFLNHLYWVAGSLIGALFGSIITFNTAGIDFAMTALFITVVVDQWRSTKNHLPAIIGAIASVICLVIFGADNFLIPAMLVILACLTLGKKLFDKEAGK